MWFTMAVKLVWKFFTSKLGISILIVAAVLGGLYGIYRAGARSELENAQKIVEAGKADAKKRIDKITAERDALEAEKKSWREQLDRAVSEAFNAQQGILDGLKSQLDEIERRGPIIKTIVREVPKYVTADADSRCVVNNGFVWLYDTALQAGPISGSGPADVDAPSGIALSAVAGVAAENNAECRARGEVITLWQDWYKRNKALYDEISAKANSR